MMTFSISQVLGAGLTLLFIAAVGIRAGRKIKNAKDFTIGGGKAAFYMVAGSIIGTLVGGSSTIATSQLAFTNGFSALWFTLGAGIGCLILGLFFAKPLRSSGSLTLQQVIRSEYGESAGLLSSIFGIIGIFLNIIAQLLSAMALLSTILPIPDLACAFIVAALMVCYVVFGGMHGASAIGVIKTVLLYACSIVCVAVVLGKCGSFSALHAALPQGQSFGLFSRGVGVDGGAALSLVLGVLSTQSYAQSVLSAKSDRAAVAGSLASAVLIPPIGIASVLVGLYMRAAFPASQAAQSFPQFLLSYFPGFWAGVFLATLLVAIIGCGAGLTLGIASIMTGNLYARIRPGASDRQKLTVNRITIVAVLLLAIVFTVGDVQSVILQWSFMSMGLRGAVVFIPLCGALFLKGRIAPKYAIASVLAGPILVLAGKLLMKGLPFDPLFLGIFANVLIMAFGIRRRT